MNSEHNKILHISNNVQYILAFLLGFTLLQMWKFHWFVWTVQLLQWTIVVVNHRHSSISLLVSKYVRIAFLYVTASDKAALKINTTHCCLLHNTLRSVLHICARVLRNWPNIQCVFANCCVYSFLYLYF